MLGVGGSTGWNGYLYANGNPANLTDASGMCPDGYDFVSCLLYDANTTLTYGPRVFGHLWDIAFGSKQQFAEDLKDSWKDGVSGWWSLHQQSLPDLWDFTFQVALPMLWEPADWISGLVNADPVALLPLVPSAGRFASHASSPLSIRRRAANHLNQSIPTGALGSFDADTTVTTSEGSVRIDQLKVDGKVLAYDEDRGEVGEYSVTAVLKHDDPIIIHLAVDGETVDTTPEHPFYTEERGWVSAGELQIEDRLRKADGSYGVVESLHTEQRTETMYNLTVEEAHTFFVGEGQSLVHNICPSDMDAVELLRQLPEDELERVLARSSKGARRLPSLEEFNPRFIDVRVSELEGIIGSRKHGLHELQWESVQKMSNDELIAFRPHDPISGILMEGQLTLTGGHHRTQTIINRLASGLIDPNAYLRILLHE